MDKIAHKIVHYLLKYGTISHSDLIVYQYGIHIGLELILCVLFCLLFSVPLGMFWESTLFFVIFFLLRSYVGGIHLPCYYQCFILSVTIHFSILLLTKFCGINSTSITLVGIFIFNLLLAFLKPVENNNREVNEEEKKQFDKIKRKHITYIQLLAIIMFIFNLKRFLILVFYTLLIIILSMILGNVVNKKKNKEK